MLTENIHLYFRKVLDVHLTYVSYPPRVQLRDHYLFLIISDCDGEFVCGEHLMFLP
jgi:hypothetical protein